MEARYWACATAVKTTALTTNDPTRSEMVRLMDYSSALRKCGWRPIDFISTKTLKKRFSRIRLLIAQPIFASQEYCGTGNLRPQLKNQWLGSLANIPGIMVASFSENVAGAPTVIAPF